MGIMVTNLALKTLGPSFISDEYWSAAAHDERMYTHPSCPSNDARSKTLGTPGRYIPRVVV